MRSVCGVTPAGSTWPGPTKNARAASRTTSCVTFTLLTWHSWSVLTSCSSYAASSRSPSAVPSRAARAPPPSSSRCHPKPVQVSRLFVYFWKLCFANFGAEKPVPACHEYAQATREDLLASSDTFNPTLTHVCRWVAAQLLISATRKGEFQTTLHRSMYVCKLYYNDLSPTGPQVNVKFNFRRNSLTPIKKLDKWSLCFL